VVEHCPVDCCAPADRLVALLNDSHLGANVQVLSPTALPPTAPLAFFYTRLSCTASYICIAVYTASQEAGDDAAAAADLSEARTALLQHGAYVSVLVGLFVAGASAQAKLGAAAPLTAGLFLTGTLYSREKALCLFC